MNDHFEVRRTTHPLPRNTAGPIGGYGGVISAAHIPEDAVTKGVDTGYPWYTQASVREL